jgi:hypothetical protein
VDQSRPGGVQGDPRFWVASDFFADSFAKNTASIARGPSRVFQATAQVPRLFIETIAVAAVMLIVVMIVAQGASARRRPAVLALVRGRHLPG